MPHFHFEVCYNLPILVPFPATIDTSVPLFSVLTITTVKARRLNIKKWVQNRISLGVGWGGVMWDGGLQLWSGVNFINYFVPYTYFLHPVPNFTPLKACQKLGVGREGLGAGCKLVYEMDPWSVVINYDNGSIKPIESFIDCGSSTWNRS